MKVRTLSLVFVSFPILIQLVLSVTSVSAAWNDGGVNLISLDGFILVILFSVSNIITAYGATLHNGHAHPDSSAESSDEIIFKLRPRILRKRFGRQISLLAPALQTMGCLPKFFCGMNSKRPSGSTSTLNDLAYLIKFAMVDDLDDSSEKEKGKDDLNDESTEDEEEGNHPRQDQKFEHLAEEELVMKDPDYLGFVWQDIKKKIRRKFKDGRVDEAVLDKMISDMEMQAKIPDPMPSNSKISNIFSGLKSLVRIGRSVDEPKSRRNAAFGRRRRKKAFWETESFDEQMKLAARIGTASDNEDQCSSTFSLCPFTVEQMKSIVTGVEKGQNDQAESEEGTDQQQETWYENVKGPNPVQAKLKQPFGSSKPNRTPTAPNPPSHVLGNNGPNGRRPSPTTTTTPKPTKKPATERTLISVKPYVKLKLSEDVETGYDNPNPAYPNDIIVPVQAKKVKIIRVKDLKKKDNSEEEEDQPSSEEEEGSPAPKKPTFPTITKPKNSQTRKPRPGLSSLDESDEKGSSEEGKHTNKKPGGGGRPRNKVQRQKIGIPRPKYSIKHKYRNRPRPLSTEIDEDNVQNKKKAAIAASDEEDKSEESKERTVIKVTKVKVKKFPQNRRPRSSEEKSSEELPPEVKLADKLKLNSKKRLQKYVLKKRPNSKLKFKTIVSNEEETEGSVESEEDEVQNVKKAEIQKSAENGYGTKSSEETSSEGGTSVPTASTSTTAGKRSEEEDSLIHPKPSTLSESPSPKHPTHPAPTPGGILSTLFGSNHRPTTLKEATPSPSYPTRGKKKTTNVRKDVGESSEEKEQQDYEESSEEEASSSTTVALPANLPPVYGTTAKPTITSSPKPAFDEKKPIVVDPDKPTAVTSKFPSLPRFPPPSKRPTTTEAPTTKQKAVGDYESSKEDDANKSADSSASKEDDNKTAESKESSEEDPNHVKNIFTKASISALGKGKNKEDDELENIQRIPPPPPPIANWQPPNTNETKAVFMNITKSPNAHATLVTPTKPVKVSPSLGEQESEEKPPASDEGKEDDSAADEDHSSEENNRKKQSQPKRKHEDDEAENREPVIIPAEEDVPELGDEVVSITPNRPPVSDQSVFPAPAVAPVSGFDKTNEIKIPTGTPPTATSSVKNTGANRRPRPAGDNRNPGEGTKAVPNAASPGGSPGGGSGPGGGRIPGSGSGNRRPGGGNGNNRRTQSNGNSGNNNQEDTSEEKSEEQIGKSSEEEKDKTSEEEEDNARHGKRGRSGVSKKNEKSNATAIATEEPKSKDTPSYSSHNYPPLPPIYKWKPEPTMITKLMKPKTVKPTLKLPKAKPTKDNFYKKPLSPKLVQYLRQTYGHAYAPPPPDMKRWTTTTTTTSRPSKSPINFKLSFEKSKLGSTVLQFDEFDYADGNVSPYSKRVGVYSRRTNKKGSTRRQTTPPVYGKITFHG